MSTLTTIVLEVLALSHIALAIAVSCHIILTKDDVRSAVVWIGFVFLSPFFGSFLYLILGVNRIHRAAIKRRQADRSVTSFERSLASRVAPDELTENSRQMYKLGQRVHPDEFTEDNSVEQLINGDEAFPAMLEAIAGARRSVALMTYIFDRDPAGLKFVEALKAAKLRGVMVRVLVDDVGIKYSKPPIDVDLNRHEIDNARFMPTRKWHFWHYVNLRNHRKMLIIDGKVAFIGGMNIRHGNVLRDNTDHPIQDIHFRVVGPVIDQMNEIFEEDWLFAKDEQIVLPSWEAESHYGDSDIIARVIPDGPDIDMEKLQWLYLGALSCSEEFIRIITPYFLPDEVMTRSLQLAALRGVSVEILVPRENNLFGFDWAMESGFKRLLEAGVRIYRSAPPFDHSKVMVVDGVWSSVGSCNWDARSFRLNFECNLECVSDDLAERLCHIFEKKKAAAEEVSLDVIRNRPALVRLRNGIARLFSPYL